MCGRLRISTDFSEIRIAFSIPPELLPPNLAPNWRKPSCTMDCGSSKIEEGLQAHCKNQPSVHGQLAGIYPKIIL
jgi:hypothetical protein